MDGWMDGEKGRERREEIDFSTERDQHLDRRTKGEHQSETDRQRERQGSHCGPDVTFHDFSMTFSQARLLP